MKDLILYKFEEGQHKFSSNGIEIINPELLGITHYPDGSNRVYMGEGTLKNVIEFRNGDSFPLPSDLKFQEEDFLYIDNALRSKKALRLVKVESEESQVFTRNEIIEFLEWLGPNTYHNGQKLQPHWNGERTGGIKRILEYYETIQRNKP